ncbi:hypothetical protein A2U01_0089137, partial [Trifolium medium]|nr:hypothetical protein [Trifolium medium]
MVTTTTMNRQHHLERLLFKVTGDATGDATAACAVVGKG